MGLMNLTTKQSPMDTTLEEEKSPTPHHKLERVALDDVGNVVYDLAEVEPKIHLRTYLAIASMILINFVQVFTLQGPPIVVSNNSWINTGVIRLKHV